MLCCRISLQRGGGYPPIAQLVFFRKNTLQWEKVGYPPIPHFFSSPFLALCGAFLDLLGALYSLKRHFQFFVKFLFEVIVVIFLQAGRGRVSNNSATLRLKKCYTIGRFLINFRTMVM